MPGLAASRWAKPRLSTSTYYSSISDRPARLDVPTSSTTNPSNTSPQPATSNATQPAASRSSLDELARYTKIVRRLKWKLPYLASAYQQAVNRTGRDPAEVDEAELMFKLDFFEYYMLLERALVHLLGVFGITISRGAFIERGNNVGREGNSPGPTGGGSGTASGSNSNGTASPRYSHRYHANVLEALDDTGNPLNPVLGIGDVRQQLARAKDLRNRWKNADDAGNAGGRDRGKPRVSAPLESYDLERILGAVFDGFDRAFVVAEQFVGGRGGGGDGSGNDSMDMDMRDAVANDAVDWTVTEEEQWEFMVEAMDWEAV